MPSSVREIRVRGDAGLYSDDTLTWLEDHGAEYAIVARLTRPLPRRITALRYRAISADRAVAETTDQATGWARTRRMIAVRKPLTDRDPLPTLFVLGRDAYHAYVTNLAVEPERVWRFSTDRAAIEWLIRELQYDDGLGHVPTRRFNANTFYVQVLRLAYNLVVGFQTVCLPDRWTRAT